MIRATALLATRRAAGELPPGAPDPNAALLQFLAERTRGTRPIAWGDQLAELALTAGIFRGTLAVDGLRDEAVADGAR
jgi:hypothetical protein